MPAFTSAEVRVFADFSWRRCRLGMLLVVALTVLSRPPVVDRCG